MRHICHRSFCATVAISAALSLGSTSLLAQEAAPTLDPPPAAEAPPAQAAASPSAPQQAPAIVLPDFEQRFRDAAAKDARDEAVPAEAPAARAGRTNSADTPRRESRGSAQSAASSPSTAQSVPAAAGDASANGPLAAPVDLPAAAREDAPVAKAEPAAAREPMDVPDEAIVAALLGVVGLGAAGFVATRRRRRDDDEEHEEEAYEPVAEEAPVPATATEYEFVDEPITSIPEELALRRPAPEVEVVDEHAVANEPVTSQSFIMPEGPVPTGEARRRLIEEMAAAPPDEANPFTSYVSRRKRARIILQARERQLRKQATEPFDWRTYRPFGDEETPRTSPVNPEKADR